MKYMVALLIVLLSCDVYQIKIYQETFPKIAWAVENLYISASVNLGMWKSCKRFNWCDERHTIPHWNVVWRGESHWEV